MFNPVTIIRSIFRWFLDTIGHLTSFTKLKFFLVTLFLLVIGWYYIQCYETPAYKTGYNMKFYAVEPIDTPSVSLLFSFGHNSLQGKITSARVYIDSFSVRSVKQTDSIYQSTELVQSKDKSFLQKILFDFHHQRKGANVDSMDLCMESNLRFPQRQPYLFKQRFLSYLLHQEDKKGDDWCRDIKFSRNYTVTEQISVHDYLYSAGLKSDSTYIICKDTLEYPIACKPQWRCKGDLSTFIFRYENNDIKNDSSAKINSIICDFNDYTHVVTMTPMPDSIWATGFAFTSPQTLEYVQLHGIDGYGKFPQMEAWQLVRTFALTTLLATLLSLFFGLLYNFIRRHPLLISFSILSIASLIVCAFIFVVSYLESASLIDSYDNLRYSQIILYAIILLFASFISSQFIYKICKKYAVNFWAVLFALVVWFICSRASMLIAESSMWIYWVFGSTSLVSLAVPLYLHLRDNRAYIQKRQRFARLYPQIAQSLQTMIDNWIMFTTYYMLTPFSLSVVLSMIIINDHSGLSMLRNLWVGVGITFFAEIICVTIYAYSLKKSKKKEQKKKGKDYLKSSIILQPFILKTMGLLLLFSLVLWWFDLSYTSTLACTGAVMLLPALLFPYIYNNALTIRYERYMHDKIVKIQQKLTKRLYRI